MVQMMAPFGHLWLRRRPVCVRLHQPKRSLARRLDHQANTTVSRPRATPLRVTMRSYSAPHSLQQRSRAAPQRHRISVVQPQQPRRNAALRHGAASPRRRRRTLHCSARRPNLQRQRVWRARALHSRRLDLLAPQCSRLRHHTQQARLRRELECEHPTKRCRGVQAQVHRLERSLGRCRDREGTSACAPL